MKVAFHTLGCKVNQYESRRLAEDFKRAGYTLVGEDEYADVYVVNTCTVTGLADRKSRQYIRRMKKVNPDSLVAAVGCYAQVSPEAVSSMKEVNIVAGTGEKDKLVQYVQSYTGPETKVYICPREELGEPKPMPAEVEISEKRTGENSAIRRSRTYIKIQEGCNRFCSYCIIPYARGPVRSRRETEILTEAKALVRAGAGEIVLTGINTALYWNLPGLLRRLDEMKGNFRVRLSSLEPTVADAAFVKEIVRSRRLCHHLHLSLQSGSDKILDAMNRRYNRKAYLDIVQVLKGFDSLYGITTDVIVGFPGEEEADFQETLDVIKQVEFCKVHGFPYSKRKGTVAASLPHQVRGEVKKERMTRLKKAAAEGALKFFERNAGTESRVIFEEPEGNHLVGYTDNYIRAYLPVEGTLSNMEKIINRAVKVGIVAPYRDGVMVSL